MLHPLNWLFILLATACVRSNPKSLPLPDIPTQHGVVYVSGSPWEMVWYDITGSEPEAAGSLDFDNPVHDLAVDSINNRLAVAVGQRVLLMDLDTPEGGIDAPTVVAELSIPDESPASVLLDPYHHRLYVQTSGHGIFHGDDHYETFPGMHIVDISDTPTVIDSMQPDGWPKMALDPVRQILFAVTGDDKLAVYDVGQDTFDEMNGSPINVRDDYPEDGGHMFQIYSPEVDPWSARFFAERQQGEKSELIAYQYDEFVPTDGDKYSDGASIRSMRNLATALDMGTDFRDRQVPLTSGPSALPDPHTGQVMVVAEVAEEWGVLSLDTNLQPGGLCADEASPVCLFRMWSEGTPGDPLPSTGTACIDSSRKIIAATTREDFSDSSMQFFQYDELGQLQPWLTDAGNALATIDTPYNAACH